MKKLLPYQERVVIERDELRLKVDSLKKFLEDYIIKDLGRSDHVHLAIQYEYMCGYLHWLNERIKTF
jgi:hypothetical protein